MNSVVSSISEMNAKAYPPAYFVNDSLPESRKLYIYGDSQWAAHRNMPTYLCENFSEVMSTRIRSVNYAADSAYDPDVVIFGCSERFIDSVLTLRQRSLPKAIPTAANMTALPHSPPRPQMNG